MLALLLPLFAAIELVTLKSKRSARSPPMLRSHGVHCVAASR